MGLNIKNEEVEKLAAEVARKAGESKTEAIRVALAERNAKLDQLDRKKAIDAYWEHLEKDVWPRLNPKYKGRHITKEEREAILGYGPDGLPQ